MLSLVLSRYRADSEIAMPPQILVVEDERLTALDVQATLEGMGYSVPVTVASGEAALRSAADSRPDLVLTDIHLTGELDGIATARELRERWDVPVVYLTAFADDATLERAKLTRPYGFLSKPFNERTLRSTIEVALQQHALELERRRQRELLTAQAEELRNLSLRDELTGLYNRRGFLTLGEQHLKVGGRGNRSVVVLMADLDGLKRINDTQGHQAGDSAIRAMADVLRQTFRDGDVVARLGGDEFAVLAVDATPSAEQLLHERLEHQLELWNRVPGRRFVLGSSFGSVARELGPQDDLLDLMGKADAIMYEEKKAKKASRLGQAA